jgi:serine/threonine-protein kinase
VAAGIVAAVAAVVWLTLGATPDHSRSQHPSARLTPVKLCSTCAYAYNPDGNGGTAQDDDQAHFAVDGNQDTGWSTQTYYSGQLDKPGVGIYVAASSSVAARKLDLVTTTPGFSASVYGSRSRPSATRFRASGWVELASTSYSDRRQTFELARGAGRSYRYYLVWITKLPPNSKSATIDEIRLYR